MFTCIVLSLTAVSIAGASSNFIPYRSGASDTGVPMRDCSRDLIDRNQIKYHFFTREQFLLEQKVLNFHKQVNASHHHVNKVTKIIIHGWNQDYSDSDLKRLALYYLLNQDVNVVLVDWSAYSTVCDIKSSMNYVKPVVAASLDRLMKSLLARGSNVTSFHVIGNNVGAHMAGEAAKLMHPHMIGRITALDYKTDDCAGIESLETGDASFVDVIHTTPLLGKKRAKVGHMRFYPNGKLQQQTECCRRLKSVKYYIRTITEPRAYESYQCESYDEYLANKCKHTQINWMGEFADQKYPGDFYFTIDDETSQNQRQ